MRLDQVCYMSLLRYLFLYLLDLFWDSYQDISKGFVDALIMRACDVMLAFPSYVVTLALIALFGMGAENIIMAFILTRWAWFCRVIRTSVMQYTASDHVRFAKTIGMNDMKIIHKHIMPLTLADIAIISSSSMCSMILQISGFSF